MVLSKGFKRQKEERYKACLDRHQTRQAISPNRWKPNLAQVVVVVPGAGEGEAVVAELLTVPKLIFGWSMCCVWQFLLP